MKRPTQRRVLAWCAILPFALVVTVIFGVVLVNMFLENVWLGLTPFIAIGIGAAFVWGVYTLTEGSDAG